MSDLGTPFVLSLPEHVDLVQTYNRIAQKVVDEVKLLDEGNLVAPHVEYDTQFGKLVIEYEGGKKTKLVDPYELRLKCRCAACIDEIDGRQILKVDKIPKDVHPTNIMQKGNYAVAMVWSDGHKSSIYPFERLLSPEITDYSKK